MWLIGVTCRSFTDEIVVDAHDRQVAGVGLPTDDLRRDCPWNKNSPAKNRAKKTGSDSVPPLQSAISDVQLIELDALSRRVADDVDSDVGTGKPDCNRIPSARRARVPLGSLCLRRLPEGRQRRSAFAVSYLQRWQPRSVWYT
ncbi:hypothetical protein [Paraburkholderia sp. PGU19]|uniref:hypothetical protein n=1 Tax=Paraburkholderia sp. PGU19 TaxID=2735434 RepID=UPI0015DB849B|nr:hypothetical protein [Paraburkholderia sp. PGU19]